MRQQVSVVFQEVYMPEITRLSLRDLVTGGIVTGVVGATLFMAGCGGGGGSVSNFALTPTAGASEPIAASSTAHSYVVSDNASIPHAIGVTIQAKALSNPPIVVNYPNGLAYILPLPSSVPSTIPFHSVILFVTAGHGPAQFPPGSGIPGPYEVPHIHVAFSLFTAAESAGIGSRLTGLTPAVFNDPAQFPTYFDSNYDLPVNSYYVPQNMSTGHPVPYVDYSSTPPGQEIPYLGTIYFNPFVPEFNHGQFTTEVDYAYYAGTLSSINVTSNLNQLVTLNPDGSVATRLPINLTAPLDLPQGYQTSGYYPTTYSIKYDPNSDSFNIELGNMVFRQATDIHGQPLPQVKKN
jgi:hypothetical protein